MADFSEMFAEQQASSIEWHGMTIYGLYEFPNIPTVFTAEFVSAKAAPVQGLHFKIRGGTLIANDTESTELVLWADSVPPKVKFETRRSGKGSVSLRVWNVWRGGRDVMQAWLGNAAMQVDANSVGSEITLRCSDGQGDPAFNDLVVAIRAQ